MEGYDKLPTVFQEFLEINFNCGHIILISTQGLFLSILGNLKDNSFMIQTAAHHSYIQFLYILSFIPLGVSVCCLLISLPILFI